VRCGERIGRCAAADESLLGRANDLARNSLEVARLRLAFERAPLKEQPQLEQWVGMPMSAAATMPRNRWSAALGEELPSRTNRYLFSAIGSDASLRSLSPALAAVAGGSSPRCWGLT